MVREARSEVDRSELDAAAFGDVWQMGKNERKNVDQQR
jgi:hypothetical protein